MPTEIDFRNCVHQGVAGPTPHHILASIRAEYCLPRAELPRPERTIARATPVVQLDDFAGLRRALGPDAFRQLASDVLRRRDPSATLADLPRFLAEHRYGRATPALVDLAELDLAIAQCDRAPETLSVGACCLPPDLLRAHPDLTLAFHPAWRWLALAAPTDRWRAELMARGEPTEAPQPRPTSLRVAPRDGQVTVQRIDAFEFAFERALQRGASFRDAEATANRGAAFDAVRRVQDLLLAGAITAVALHPPAQATTDHHQPPQQSHGTR